MRRRDVIAALGATAAAGAVEFRPLRVAAKARLQAPLDVRVTDLTPVFLPLVGRTDSTAVQTVRTMLLDAHPVMFGAVLGGAVSAVPDAGIVSYLAALAPLRARMATLAAEIGTALPDLVRHFRATFADLAPGTPIDIIPSFDRFDGRWDLIAGRDTLLIGIDGCAKHAADFAFPVLFDHELFHVHHAPQLRPHEAALASWGLRAKLWMEGLAVHVSQQLNPGTSDARALSDHRLAEIVRDPTTIARALLAVVDDGSDAMAARWFESTTSDGSIPARAGYAIGLLVARRIAARHSLAECAKLYDDDLRGQIDASLRAIAT